MSEANVAYSTKSFNQLIVYCWLYYVVHVYNYPTYLYRITWSNSWERKTNWQQ